MRISKPLLAATFDETKTKYPYIATPKIDGIRFLMVDGVAVSRTFKPIRNRYIQGILSKTLPDGIDGELTCGDTFQSSTSAVMSIEGEPDFVAWLFDYVEPKDDHLWCYVERIEQLKQVMTDSPDWVRILDGIQLNSPSELARYESECLAEGYEGVMVRDLYGTYKFGRATVNENILLKVKRFEDAEAILVDIEEKMHNTNTAEKDNFGRTKRSSAAAGMVGAGTAGTLIVKDADGRSFGVGSGLNDQQRQEIWDNKDQYLGKLVKYKYFSHGVKDLPRHPVFQGFRDPDDM
jgi:DNA ligase-1